LYLTCTISEPDAIREFTAVDLAEFHRIVTEQIDRFAECATDPASDPAAHWYFFQAAHVGHDTLEACTDDCTVRPWLTLGPVREIRTVIEEIDQVLRAAPAGHPRHDLGEGGSPVSLTLSFLPLAIYWAALLGTWTALALRRVLIHHRLLRLLSPEPVCRCTHAEGHHFLGVGCAACAPSSSGPDASWPATSTTNTIVTKPA
jgi:hypothetical protein